MTCCYHLLAHANMTYSVTDRCYRMLTYESVRAYANIELNVIDVTFIRQQMSSPQMSAHAGALRVEDYSSWVASPPVLGLVAREHFECVSAP